MKVVYPFGSARTEPGVGTPGKGDTVTGCSTCSTSGRRLLTAIPYAETREDAERQKRAFQSWCAKKGVAAVGQALDQDWDRPATSTSFRRRIGSTCGPRTPSSRRSPVRLRTAAAKRYKKVENATAVIWKTLLIAERTFRCLDAPELLAEVANGVVYVNRVRQWAQVKPDAA